MATQVDTRGPAQFPEPDLRWVNSWVRTRSVLRLGGLVGLLAVNRNAYPRLHVRPLVADLFLTDNCNLSRFVPHGQLQPEVCELRVLAGTDTGRVEHAGVVLRAGPAGPASLLETQLHRWRSPDPTGRGHDAKMNVRDRAESIDQERTLSQIAALSDHGKQLLAKGVAPC